MSKFQSTISTVAALTTIFGAAVGGWKIAEQQREYNSQQQVIDNLQQKLEGEVQSQPKATQEQPTQIQPVQVEQKPVIIKTPQSPPPPLPPVPESE